jgi:hypothetical protein
VRKRRSRDGKKTLYNRFLRLLKLINAARYLVLRFQMYLSSEIIALYDIRPIILLSSTRITRTPILIRILHYQRYVILQIIKYKIAVLNIYFHFSMFLRLFIRTLLNFFFFQYISYYTHYQKHTYICRNQLVLGKKYKFIVIKNLNENLRFRLSPRTASGELHYLNPEPINISLRD